MALPEALQQGAEAPLQRAASTSSALESDDEELAPVIHRRWARRVTASEVSDTPLSEHDLITEIWRRSDQGRLPPLPAQWQIDAATNAVLQEASAPLALLRAMGFNGRMAAQVIRMIAGGGEAFEVIVRIRPTLTLDADVSTDAVMDMLAMLEADVSTDAVMDMVAARQLAENQQAAAEGMAREAPRTIDCFEQILRELHASESDGAWGADGVEGFHEDLLEGVPALALARSLGEPALADLELFRDVTESPAWAALRAQVTKHCGSDPLRRQALLDDIAQEVRHKQDLASPALSSQAARQVLASVHDADRLGLASCLELAWKRGPWAEGDPV